MPDNSVRIAELREELADAVTETQVGSTKTRLDLKSKRRELARLEAEDDTGNQTPKSKLVQVDLG